MEDCLNLVGSVVLWRRFLIVVVGFVRFVGLFFFFCFFFLVIVGFGSGLFLVGMEFGVIGLGRGSIVGVLFVEEVGDLVNFLFRKPVVTVFPRRAEEFVDCVPGIGVGGGNEFSILPASGVENLGGIRPGEADG